MKQIYSLILLFSLVACEQNSSVESNDNKALSKTSSENPVVDVELEAKQTTSLSDIPTNIEEEAFVRVTERFSDIKIIRYKIPGFDLLTLQQKKLVYYLVQAGLAGRDIMWDQNYRHNLSIRRALEAILRLDNIDETSKDWEHLNLYARQVFFANGIHHHYSGDKFTPKFTEDYFKVLLAKTDVTLNEDAVQVIFDESIDAKKVTRDSSKDIVKNSAINFYDADITDQEVSDFYNAMSDPADKNPVLHGLNSKVIRQKDGSLAEKVWYAKGMYANAINEIIGWLEQAVSAAENKPQGDALKLLIEYYKTGDLKIWDDYNIAWTTAIEGDVDYIHSFIEVYQDPKGYKGSFESIVQIKDFEASKRMQVVANNAQWFEDNSTTDIEHKKANVTGITYNVVNVAGESGEASPSTPVGVNLPNSDWIRAQHGSKSISLGNIVNAYRQASNPGLLKEFAHDVVEIKRSEAHKELSGKLRTALHEVIGHASGKLEEGVATPKETLKNYASALEEARADLVALYFILDEKLVEMELVPSLEVGKASYDSFILNGLMLQLRRIEPGKNIEQAHMRNRQMIASWVYEKGFENGVIIKEFIDDKTYFDIKDYDKLRDLFGELLKEVQRIKSQGDYEAAQNLIETYGVNIDQPLHKEVLQRTDKLDIASYSGFINPRLVEVLNESGEVIDIDVEYPDNFVAQMLEYGENFSFLPNYN